MGKNCKDKEQKGNSGCHIFSQKGRDNYDLIFKKKEHTYGDKNE